MPRSMVPATIVFICRLTTWQSRRRTGTVSGSNSSRRASPSTIAVFPTPGSPINITELGRSRWHRISSTCCISFSRAKTGGILSCRARRFRLVAKCLRNAGSSKRFLSRSSRSSISRIRALSRETRTPGSTPWWRRIDTGTPWLSSNTAENRSAASIVCRPARLAWCSASLNTSLVAGETRSSGPGNGGIMCRCSSIACRIVWGFSSMSRMIPGEQVPLDLRERQEDMLAGEQRVLPAPGLLDRAIHDSLRGFGNLAR